MSENKIEEKNDEWKIAQNRFFTFIDILGFKDYVYNRSHEEVEKKMNLLKNPIQTLKKLGSKEIEPKKEMEQKIGKIPSHEIKTIIFSDTIMLVSINDSIFSFGKIMYLSALFIMDCLLEKFPVKGAISHGQLTIDTENSLYFGRPLIDAYLLESELQYYGIVLHHSMEDYYIRNRKSNAFEFSDSPKGALGNFSKIIEYKTPLKSAKTNHYNIIWFPAGSEKISKPPIYATVSDFYRSTSGKNRLYIDNTLDFIDYVYDLMDEKVK